MDELTLADLSVQGGGRKGEEGLPGNMGQKPKPLLGGLHKNIDVSSVSDGLRLSFSKICICSSTCCQSDLESEKITATNCDFVLYCDTPTETLDLSEFLVITPSEQVMFMNSHVAPNVGNSV